MDVLCGDGKGGGGGTRRFTKTFFVVITCAPYGGDEGAFI